MSRSLPGDQLKEVGEEPEQKLRDEIGWGQLHIA